METARLARVGSSHHTCTSFRTSFAGASVLRPAPRVVALPPRRSGTQQIRAAVIAEPAKLVVKTFKGDSVGSENLSLKVADSSVAKGLVHRYVVLIRQNGRAGTASTKTRAEVRGGGKKPYAQKGTGNARQGSRRTPLKPGGGVVFGPRPCDWTIKMNKKERRLALATALQSAADSITVVEDLTDSVPEPKTKIVTAGLAAVGVDLEKEYALLIVHELFPNLKLASRNIDRLRVNTIDLLSAYDVLRADKIIVEKSALKYIQDFFGGAGPVDVEEPEVQPEPVAA